MKVVILCGGLGTRISEETEFRPKPMVEIGGRPILWHIMKIYAHHGFRDFVLCLGHKGAMIKDYFYHYELLNNDFTVELGTERKVEMHSGRGGEGWRVTLADTGDKTLKGARLKRVERYVDGDEFMVTYGDGVGDVDIGALVRFHRGHGKMATVTGINPSSGFGELGVKADRVESFTEKPENRKGLYSGGFFVFNREFFSLLSDRQDCDLEYGPLEQLARDGQLMVYRHRGFWACMDTQRDMDHLNGLWDRGEAGWKVW